MKTLTTFFSVIVIFATSINDLSAVILPPYSGYSVSVSGDYLMWGQEQLIENKPGKAYIKHSVTFQEWLLTANNGRNGDRFGRSVSIDGNWAIIGADGDDTVGAEAGAAYIFHFDGTNWVQQQKIVGLDTTRDDGFGCSVCISGDFAIVGAYGNNGKGAAYIFYFNGTRWVQQAKITANDAPVNDLFGWSVSINNNYAIVGDPFNDLIDGVIDDSGAVYIFYYDGTNWVQQAKLVASDPESFNRFGYSVSISVDYAIAGSLLDDDFGTDSGSAYIFHRNGTNWEQVQKLTADNAKSGDWFGYSVSINEDYTLVGSPLDNYKNIDSGSVFLYKYDGTKWALRGKLTGTSASTDTRFGLYVCTKSNKIIMGGTGTASWLLSMPSIDLIQDTPEAGSSFNFRINVNVPFDVEPITLYYRQGAKSTFNNVSFTLESGTYKDGIWVATIPANQITTRGIEYYIVAPERDRNRNIYYYGTMNDPYFLPVHGNIDINLQTTIIKNPNIWNIIAPSVITDNKNIVQNLGSLGVFGLNW
ncbi:MAG: FG-GAP repeat protein, partial [Candidatus Poribacteria bacterium]